MVSLVTGSISGSSRDKHSPIRVRKRYLTTSYTLIERANIGTKQIFILRLYVYFNLNKKTFNRNDEN